MTQLNGEREYINLRKQLEDLDYHEPFTPDSVSLVRQLLNDILASSERHQELGATIHKLEEQVISSKEQVVPLRRENARLVRENNQLHLAIIKQAEEIDKREKEWKLEIKKFQGQTSDAHFLKQQNLNKVNALEMEVERLQAKLAQVSNKDVVTITAGNKEVLSQGQFSGKDVGADILHGGNEQDEEEEDYALPQVDENQSASGPIPAKGAENQPANANSGRRKSVSDRKSVSFHDRMSVAFNDRMSVVGSVAGGASAASLRAMEDKVRNSEIDRQSMSNQLEQAKKSIELRDAEIKRLGEALEQGADTMVGRAKSINKSNAQVLEQLTDQIDFLTAQLAESERKLTAAVEDAQLNSDAKRKLDHNEDELVTLRAQLLMKDHRIQQLESTVASGKKPPRSAADAKSGGEDEEFGSLLAAYQSDKQRFSREIQSLQTRVAQKEEQCVDLRSEVESLSRNKAQVEAKLAVSESTVTSLTRDLDILQETLVRTKGDAVDVDERAALAKKQVERMEGAIQAHIRDNEFLRVELDRAQSDAKMKQELVHRLELENQKVTHTLSMEKDSSRHEQQLVSTLQGERSHLQTEIDGHLETIRTLKGQLQEKTVEHHELSNALAEKNVRIEHLDAEVRRLGNRLEQKAKEYDQEVNARKQLDQYADLPDTVRELEEQQNRWRVRAGELDAESRRLAREAQEANRRVEELLKERQELDRALAQSRDALEAEKATSRGLSNKLEDTAIKVRGLESDKLYYESLAREKEAAIGSRVQNESAYKAELDAVTIELQRAESQLESFHTREQLLEGQVKDLRNELQVTEKEHANTRKALNTSQVEIRRLSGVLDVLSKDRDNLLNLNNDVSADREAKASEVRALTSQLGDERGRTTELETQVEQLKSLLSQLDGTRVRLERRLKDLRTAQEHARKEHQSSEHELANTKELFRRESEKVKHMENVVKELLRQKDEFEAQMDKEASTVKQLIDTLKVQEQKFREMEKNQGSSVRQVHAQAASLKEKEASVQALEARVQQQAKQIEELSFAVDVRQNDLGSAAQDLAHMTRENQSVNSALQGLRVERDRVRAELGEAMARGSRLEGLLDSAKLEKADVLAVYRRACDDAARYKRMVQEMSAAKSKMLGELEVERGEVARLRKAVAELEEIRRKMRVDVQANERQVGELTRRLRETESMANSIADDRELAERNASSARDLTKNFAEAQNGLRWELGQAKVEAQQLSMRLEQLQRENSALNEQLSQERHRFREMEAIVQRTRESEARAVIAEQEKSEQVIRMHSQMLEMSSNASRPGGNIWGNNRSPRTQSPMVGDTDFDHLSLPSSLAGVPHRDGDDAPGKDEISAPGSASSSLHKKCEDLEQIISEQSHVIRSMSQGSSPPQYRKEG